MPGEVCNEFTYLFKISNCSTIEVCEWISNFIPHYVVNEWYISMTEFKLIHIEKVPGKQSSELTLPNGKYIWVFYIFIINVHSLSLRTSIHKTLHVIINVIWKSWFIVALAYGACILLSTGLSFAVGSIFSAPNNYRTHWGLIVKGTLRLGLRNFHDIVSKNTLLKVVFKMADILFRPGSDTSPGTAGRQT